MYLHQARWVPLELHPPCFGECQPLRLKHVHLYPPLKQRVWHQPCLSGIFSVSKAENLSLPAFVSWILIFILSGDCFWFSLVAGRFPDFRFGPHVQNGFTRPTQEHKARLTQSLHKAFTRAGSLTPLQHTEHRFNQNAGGLGKRGAI